MHMATYALSWSVKEIRRERKQVQALHPHCHRQIPRGEHEAGRPHQQSPATGVLAVLFLVGGSSREQGPRGDAVGVAVGEA
jgi:hypothetical protein